MYRWLTVAGFILGLFMSMGLQAPSTGVPATPDSPRELGKETAKRLEEEQKTLKRAVSERRMELAELQKGTSEHRSALGSLNSELETQRLLAGLVPVVGPGLQVILDDSSLKRIPAGDDAGQYVVQDYDVRDVVAVLWQSGAEAIAVGDERVVSSTSFYNVGRSLLVNDTMISSPYSIVAIGPPAMEEMLGSPARLQRLKESVRKYGLQFKVSRARELRLPAFSGRLPGRYARPGDPG